MGGVGEVISCNQIFGNMDEINEYTHPGWKLGDGGACCYRKVISFIMLASLRTTIPPLEEVDGIAGLGWITSNTRETRELIKLTNYKR